MAYDRSQMTDWINSAPPTDLVAVGKQVLSKIAALPAQKKAPEAEASSAGESPKMIEARASGSAPAAADSSTAESGRR